MWNGQEGGAHEMKKKWNGQLNKYSTVNSTPVGHNLVNPNNKNSHPGGFRLSFDRFLKLRKTVGTSVTDWSIEPVKKSSGFVSAKANQ